MFGFKYTPILTADGILPADNLIIKFKESNKDIEQEITDLIVEKIKEFDLKQKGN